MSHAEIWDDSALVNSWNDALEEYRQYHSISARGERVQDILKTSENQSNRHGGAMDFEDEEVNDLLADDLHAKKSFPKETDHRASSLHDEKPRVSSSDPQNGPQDKVDEEQRAVMDQASGPTTSKGPEISQHLIGQVHDEGLKNLLMAWYYAGYYTGLMEGKQQGAAGKVEPADK